MTRRMELHEVVMKLTGPIYPVGETNADDRRFDNLKEMTGLVDHLLYEILNVAAQANRPEASIARAGRFADGYLKEIRKE